MTATRVGSSDLERAIEAIREIKKLVGSDPSHTEDTSLTKQFFTLNLTGHQISSLLPRLDAINQAGQKVTVQQDSSTLSI